MPESTSESFAEKASKIQCPHIQLAIDHIAEHGISAEESEVHYLERGDEDKPNRYSPNGWATQHQNGKWIGIKEVIRVAYLFAIGVTPNLRFSDDDLHEIGPPPGVSREECDYKLRWSTRDAKKIIEKCNFVCEDKSS